MDDTAERPPTIRSSARNEELLMRFERVTLWPMMGLVLISLVTLIISWTLHLSAPMQASLERSIGSVWSWSQPFKG